MKRIDGKLKLEKSLFHPQNVQNNRSIMDDFKTMNLGKKTMKILNKVRLYKRVTYLSDIIHPHTPYILECYLEEGADRHSY